MNKNRNARRLLVALSMILSVIACVAQQTPAAPLKPIRTIELPGAIKGPFDHFGIDLKNNRLFATAEAYKAVLVVDLNTGKVIHEIPVEKPHAVLYRDDLDRIYVTDGVDGSLKIFDGRNYELQQRVGLAKDADSIGYDPSRKLLYVVNGGKDEGQKYSLLSVIDTTTGKKVAELKIDGETLEALALDLFRPKLYVNNTAKNEIEVVDRWKNKVIATWPVTLAKRNVAMAVDEAHQRLFTGCRSGQIVVFDTNTGQELQALPIAPGVDDLTYDSASKRLYAAGNGSIDVLEEVDADHYKSVGRVEAGGPARTARLVAQLNLYFVAVPQSGSRNAAIAVFEPVPAPPAHSATNAAVQPVTAPAAENLLLSTLSAHPDLRKMGLHAVPPGQTDSLIIANANTSRIGNKSSNGDLEAVKDGNTYCQKKEDGAFYNLKLPLRDAAGRRIGILVMEIPFTSATDERNAIQQAESIRQELAQQIPEVSWLFKN